MELEPIGQRETAVDACVRALRRAILAGELAPGERLPAERALATRLGVNRTTLRSALARLASEHLLSVRQGSGYVVRDYERTGGPDLLPSLARLAETAGHLAPVAADLLLVRRQLARAVLDKLAATSADLDTTPITDALDAFERAVAEEATPQRAAEADVDVLAAILEATGSRVLRLCLNPVVQVLVELPELRDAIYADPTGSVEGYRVLVHWLDDRDPGAIDAIVAEMRRRDEITVARLAESEGSPS